MQEISRGKKCLLSINVAKVGAVQNAVKIDTHIISPSGVVSCVANGYDELNKVVALIISGDVLNEVGAYSIDLRLVFADSVIIVPTFAFAEVVEGEVPCYGVSEVYVSIEGGEVVPSGNTTTIEFVSREEFKQLSNAVANKVDKVAGKGLSTNDYTDAQKAKVAEIEGLKLSIASKANTNGDYPNMTVGKAQGVVGISQVQEALSLITKANGNIVIGNLAGQSKEFMPATPSGEPQHYAYVAAGAVWNANTGDWALNEITNITTSEMRNIYREAYFLATEGLLASWFGGSTQRTNICLCRWQASAPINTFGNCVNMEVVTLGVTGYNAIPTNLNYAFYPCRKLRKIITTINCGYVSSANSAFNQCYALEYVRLLNLKTSISFADSPLLSKESLLYMINNCASNATFTITLHPDVHDRCNNEWLEDIDSALGRADADKQTNITLASA